MLRWFRNRTAGDPLKCSNEAWVQALQGRGRDRALGELREILVVGLKASLRGRAPREPDSLAEDIAQEALLRILEHLESFRGEARFTTWAMKIANRIAISELRRKRWRDVSLDDIITPDAGLTIADVLPDVDTSPAETTEDRMHVAIVREVIENDLSDKQRIAVEAVFMEGMPIEVLAEKLGSNRNAVYKLLHDARKRLRAALEARGVSVDDILRIE
jgi:RNA polymerase sigma-70 factor, ECF subfamily